MTVTASLGPGVTLQPEEGLLIDEVRGQTVPLNETAAYTLYCLREQTIDECVDGMASTFDIERDVVSSDVQGLCQRLNSRALVNLGGYRPRHYLEWLRGGFTLLRQGVIPRGLPGLVRRHRVDTTSAFSTITSTFRGGILTALGFGIGLGVLLLLTTTIPLGAEPSVFGVVFAGLVGLSIGLSILLHELGHALTLRGVPTVLITRGFRVMLLHLPVVGPRSALVAAAGPLFAGAIGYVLLGLSYLTETMILIPLSLSLILQVMGLTTVAEDGKHLLGARSEVARWLREEPGKRAEKKLR